MIIRRTAFVEIPEGLCVVIKTYRADAHRLADRLRAIDEVHVEAFGDRRLLQALDAAGCDLGLLVVSGYLPPEVAEDLDATDFIWLCVSAGGPFRNGLRSTAFTLIRKLPSSLRDPTEFGAAPRFTS